MGKRKLNLYYGTVKSPTGGDTPWPGQIHGSMPQT
jgi:hypothetical protein